MGDGWRSSHHGAIVHRAPSAIQQRTPTSHTNGTFSIAASSSRLRPQSGPAPAGAAYSQVLQLSGARWHFSSGLAAAGVVALPRSMSLVAMQFPAGAWARRAPRVCFVLLFCVLLCASACVRATCAVQQAHNAKRKSPAIPGGASAHKESAGLEWWGCVDVAAHSLPLTPNAPQAPKLPGSRQSPVPNSLGSPIPLRSPPSPTSAPVTANWVGVGGKGGGGLCALP
eukprot:scaffold5390_cov116-Isochrysis_galbana.AAC.4